MEKKWKIWENINLESQKHKIFWSFWENAVMISFFGKKAVWSKKNGIMAFQESIVRWSTSNHTEDMGHWDGHISNISLAGRGHNAVINSEKLFQTEVIWSGWNKLHQLHPNLACRVCFKNIQISHKNCRYPLVMKTCQSLRTAKSPFFR